MRVYTFKRSTLKKDKDMSEYSLRVALVGVGYHGPLFPKILEHSGNGSKIVALVDTDSKALSNAAQQMSIFPDACYASLDDFFNRQSGVVDAVIVSTPAPVRQPVIDCLNNGYHIFCENPLSLSYDVAQKAVSVSTRKKKVLAVDEQWHMLSSIDCIDCYVQENKSALGDLKRIVIGGKGRSGWTEFTRIGTHLLAVAQILGSNHGSCVEIDWMQRRFIGCSGIGFSYDNAAPSFCHYDPDVIQATFFTNYGIPVAAEFVKDKEPDVRRAFIELQFESGRIRAVGGLLERVYYFNTPRDTGASLENPPIQIFPSVEDLKEGAWEIINPGEEAAVLADSAMNPTFDKWEGFECSVAECVRDAEAAIDIFRDREEYNWLFVDVAAASEALAASIAAKGRYVFSRAI